MGSLPSILKFPLSPWFTTYQENLGIGIFVSTVTVILLLEIPLAKSNIRWYINKWSSSISILLVARARLLEAIYSICFPDLKGLRHLRALRRASCSPTLLSCQVPPYVLKIKS